MFPSFFVIGKYGACNFGIILAELNLPVGTSSNYIFEGEADAVVRASASHQRGLISNRSVDAILGLSLLLVLLRFSPLHKNQRFQIPILPGMVN